MNDLRKQSGLTIEDRIELYVAGPEEVMLAVKEHEAALVQEHSQNQYARPATLQPT